MAKHSPECRMAFGRKDPSCPRCQELLRGEPPVEWRDTQRTRMERQSIAAIKAHDCKQANCGPVCTFGDW